jgi:hypothetical protein
MIYLLLPPFQNIRASPAGPRIASARGRTGPTGPARRLRMPQRCDASGPTRPARRIGPPNLGHSCVGADCPPVSSHVGLDPTWQRLNGRERCWSKAGRAAWPSAAPPRRFSLCCGIGSLLRRSTHGEVTSMPAFGPPRRHPMPSGLFKAVAPGQSSTPTLPSPLFPTVVLHTTAGRR